MNRYAYIKGYVELERESNILKNRNSELEQENKILKDQLDFQPGGEGYKEAEEHFKSLVKINFIYDFQS